MTIQTIRPNAEVAVGGTVNASGGGTRLTNIQDNSDSTGAQFTGTNASYEADFTTYTLTANQRVLQARGVLRFSQLNGDFTADVQLRVGSGSYVTTNNIATSVANQGATTYNQSWRTTNPSGTEWLQADVDSIRLKVAQTGGTTAPLFQEWYIDLDVRSQVTLASVSPTGSTNPGSTRRPTLSVVPTDPDGGTLNRVRFKVFSAAQYGAGGFDPETSTSTYDSGTVNISAASGSTVSHTMTTSLADGTYKTYVKVAKDFNGSDWYSAWGSSASAWTISDAPAAPTSVTPSSGSTVTTDLPTLGGTFPIGTLANPARVKAQWQIASDSGFTTNVKTITEPDTDLVSTTQAHTEVVPSASQLSQGAGVPGTWWIRARSVDEYGTNGAYSTGTSFTVSHPPSASNMSPTGNQYLQYGGSGTVTFSWTFTDSSPVDFQTAYQILIERNDTGASVIDTGKVTSGSATSSQNIPVGQKDQPLRWKIQLWDRDNVPSTAYSGSQLFKIGDPPTVTITAPTSGGTVTNPSPAVTWTFSDGGSRTQANYRLVYTRAGVTLLDTGVLSGTALTYTPTNALYNNGDTGTVTVTVTDSAGMSNSTSVTFTVSFTPPAGVPFFVDTTNFDTLGYNEIEWARNYMPATMATLEGLGTGTYSAGDWGVYGNSSGMNVVSSPVDSGTRAIQVVKSVSTGPVGIHTVRRFVVTPGKTYIAFAKMQASAGGYNGQVALQWQDAAFNNLTQTTGTATALSNSAMTLVIATGVAPANAAFVDVYFYGTSIAVPDTITFDSLGFGRGSSATNIISADGQFAAWRIYRKKATDSSWTLIGSDLNPAGPSVTPATSGSPTAVDYDAAIYKDYLCPANTLVQYQVVQAATRFGTTVESLLPVNLVRAESDSNFEGSTLGWTASHSAFLDSSRSYYGSKSMKWIAQSAANLEGYPTSKVAVVAGSSYTATFLVYLGTANAGTTNLRSTFYWYTSASGANGTSTATLTGTAVVGAWAFVSFVATAPASSAQLLAAIDWTSAGAGEYIQVDDYWVTETPLAATSAAATSVNPHYVSAVGNDYWLIYPTDTTKNFHFFIVTQDDYSEEYEQQDLQLIGRGRKGDFGTRWGFKGQMTAQLWDDNANSANTARAQKQALEALRAVKAPLFLRNPFGDVWQVVPQDISVSRIAGVGPREYGTVTIPYEEVA